jgi:putative lipase involved disintegration of autophagic bodies
MKTVVGLLFLGVLFVGSQAYAQGQCSQGSTYCDNLGYQYLCVCWTGRPCYWMYSGRCR